jgi:hypothetical protein
MTSRMLNVVAAVLIAGTFGCLDTETGPELPPCEGKCDGPGGSGYRFAGGLDPHPADRGLELGVAALSVMIVAAGPLGRRRRQRAL